MSKKSSKKVVAKPWEPMERATLVIDPKREEAIAKLGIDRDSIAGEIWVNNRFTVIERTDEYGQTHLHIRRNDRAAHRDWRMFQRIKNDICGPEREGCELYPAESRLVDTANSYHIYVLPEGASFPFGMHGTRLVSDSLDRDPVMRAAAPNARQRKLA